MRLREAILGGAGGGSARTDVLMAVVRIFAGCALSFAHGLGKVLPSERFIDGVGNMGFPIPVVFAYAAAASEFLGGLMLAAGLLTRPSSFFILLTMLTAGFIRHSDDPFSSMEKSLLYAALATVFLAVGGGRYSVDRWMRERWKTGT